ncbi:MULTISPECIES: MtrB/PioB family decaheme-associated outer membrane protein [Comamonadaceae]|uniref:MtrB/PioB family decaheme-associated outer membrane protein n=1 Tax=Comamonadaceae TaxID=80864 RepID=UPI002735CA62|nr:MULTISPECIES: MtrB/PioB family decaheme-associated outer membrane protein [Comamonadaceae]MDP3191338.1 MtrB/PioB family decaheme-associated outer membrane protein [Rhodoferax sp.]MDP3338446.1 MtrB/PioB family decaheme-associated outer membrane protein [Rhodoferax sp.]MDP3886521.1 MtrB/PioB family decaheme-associated outer membrane protein [Hydrogenophaga sp.]
MKSTTEKRFARTVLAASMAAIGVAAVPALAADDDVAALIRPDNQIELGVGYVSDPSFKFGNFTGLHDNGAHLIGNIDLNRRNEANTHYFSLTGRNLGLSSRNLTIEGGEQGNYGLRFEYDEIPSYFSDTFQTPYLGAGTNRLTQPAGVTDGATVGAIAGLVASMKPYNVKTQRKGLGFGITKELSRGWDVEFGYKRENKDGDKLTAAMIQTGTGGSRTVVIVPEPINYSTDQFEAVARYADEKLQFQFGYYGSLFKNANDALTWDNLFTGTGNATGSYGLAPDNEFHQVNASGRYVLSKATNLSANVSFGRMTQNEQFLPYSTPGAAMVGALPLPRPSLDGKVYTTNASLRLNSKLTPKLNLTAGLRYDDRDNKTPISTFLYVAGDRNAGFSAAANSGTRRRNMPLDITKQSVYADLDYHLSSATTVKLGYDFHQVRHNYEPTTGDKEHTLKTEVKHRFGDMVSATASYAYSDRQASAYNGAAPLASTYDPVYLATLAGGTTGRTYPWLEAPTLRKYILADRQRDKFGATANVSPSEILDLQFGAHYMRDKYPDTMAGIGLTKASNWIASFDANLQATDKLSGNFYASVDQYKTDQNGAHLNNATLTTQAELGTIPASNLGVTTLTDRTLTLGLGVRYKPTAKYEFGANVSHSDSKGRSDFVAGSAVTIAPLPNLVSRVSRLEMFGRYDLRKDLTVNVKFAHERYSSNDWAWDAPLTLTSVTSVVGTNQTSPNYSINFVGVSLAYRF